MTWNPFGGGSASNVPAENETSLSKTATSAVAVGDIINAAIYFDTSSGATGAVLNDQLGNSYVRKTAGVDGPNTARVETFLCIVTVAGTPTVTAQFNPTPGTTVSFGPSLAIDPFTGSDAASTADGTGAAQLQTAPTTGTDATTSGTWTTSTNGDLIYTATVATGTGNNPGAAGTGFTALQTSPGVIVKTAYKVQSTASASAAGLWTAAVNDNHVTGAHAVTPASGGGGGVATKGNINLVGQSVVRGSTW